MKKVLSILVVYILIFVFSINAMASSYRIEWSNTIIEMPLFESVEDYKYLPKAYLYVDNILKRDAIINYSYDGDWLYYLDDVDTTKVGEYQVWYKAYESKYKPGTCPGYRTLVTFRVVDNTPPEITLLSDYIKIRRGVEFHLEDNIIVKDNSNTDVQIKTIGGFDNDVIGTYTIKVVAIDASYNQSDSSFVIEIYDDRAPEITFKGNSDKILEVNILDSSFNIKDYFEATDGCGNDITDKIEYSALKLDEVGSFEYTVKVTNDANIESAYSITINVVDNSIPEIILKKDSIIWDFEESVNNLNYYDYIESLTDNGQILNIHEVMISGEVNQKVGSYTITYEYFDGTNTAIKYLTVKVLSTKSPKIYASNITTKKGEMIDVLDYIEIEDDSDLDILSSVIVSDEAVDYDTPGKYEVSVYAINSSGNSITKSFYIIIEDNNEIDTKDYVIYALVGTIVIIVIIGTIIILRRKKQNQFKNI